MYSLRFVRQVRTSVFPCVLSDPLFLLSVQWCCALTKRLEFFTFCQQVFVPTFCPRILTFSKTIFLRFVNISLRFVKWRICQIFTTKCRNFNEIKLLFIDVLSKISYVYMCLTKRAHILTFCQHREMSLLTFCREYATFTTNVAYFRQNVNVIFSSAEW